VILPADGHVHTEWSWDTVRGDMDRTCARAVEIGLPAVAFTEHVDHASWTVRESDLTGDYEHLKAYLGSEGLLTPPTFDLDGYLECLDRCRTRYPDVRIISGVELGEPHWFGEQTARLLREGGFERVLGSLHCLPVGDQHSEMSDLYQTRPAADVVRDYLAEIPRMVAASEVFGVLAHIDYAIRYWPTAKAGPFAPQDFEEELRHALRALADGGRVLEFNTRGPRLPEIVRWWREEGGEAVTFGSDAHTPDGIALDFRDAVALVEAQGFRPGRHPYDTWIAVRKTTSPLRPRSLSSL
jgi:histidinol-phosphatase (PHP family)